jgi:hypothetical protein
MVEHYEEERLNTTNGEEETYQKCFQKKEQPQDTEIVVEGCKKETLDRCIITSEMGSAEVGLIDSGNGYYY